MMRGIALAGGGSFGAMEVGAVEELVKAGRLWDLQTGVSAGALNAALLGQAQQMSELPEWTRRLKELWLKTRSKDVYEYSYGPANLLNSEALAWAGSLLAGHESVYKLIYDLAARIDPAKLASSSILTGFGFVDFTSGNYMFWDNRSHPVETLIPAVRASIAIPITFAPGRGLGLNDDGEEIVGLDGGVVEGTPALDAMRYLWKSERSPGERPELYIIIPSTLPANYLGPGLTPSLEIGGIELKGWPAIGERAVGLMARALHIDDVRMALLANQLQPDDRRVSVRLIYPEQLHGRGLEWDPQMARANIEEGSKAAKRLMDVEVIIDPGTLKVRAA